MITDQEHRADAAGAVAEAPAGRPLSDPELQRRVMEALRWDPTVDATRVAVAVEANGVVTLSGHVDRFADRLNAERAAKRVAGVRAVVNEIVVKPAQITDDEIAEAAVEALKWNIFVPSKRIKVSVSNGWVTLDGEVTWRFQREAAEEAIYTLDGVTGVTNRIRVGAHVHPADLKERIREAFLRDARLDASRIDIGVDGARVTLRGVVRSYIEREEAERVVWSARGVEDVQNLIRVDPRPNPKNEEPT